MKNWLDYRQQFLCVVAEFDVLDGPNTRTLLRQWYPVRQAEQVEVEPLIGRPLTVVNLAEGTYVDEDGEVYQVTEGATTKAIDIERFVVDRDQAASGPGTAGAAMPTNTRRNRARKQSSLAKAGGVNGYLPNQSSNATAEVTPTVWKGGGLDASFPDLNLRQKLALVRRRMTYVQKRGVNEDVGYTYATAADVAGSIGDLFAELGVIVIPRLESISQEPLRPHANEAEHVTRVIMTYSFVDVNSAEELAVKVAGEGVDAGDKAPYKAMTGALKYALLQSFLLSTGDDPEQGQRPAGARPPSSSATAPERTINREEKRELCQLLEQTGTEIERVLAYYKLDSLDRMTETIYRRALVVLQRKRAMQPQKGASEHAKN